MLLKTLLSNVIKWIDTHPIDTGALIIKIEASYLNRDTEQFILGLDVRQLGTLRALVPQAFPRKLRHGEVTVQKNSIGAWRVDPVEVAHG